MVYCGGFGLSNRNSSYVESFSGDAGALPQRDKLWSGGKSTLKISVQRRISAKVSVNNPAVQDSAVATVSLFSFNKKQYP
jgi:hypothetical protein